MFLTPAERKALTGFTKPSAQIRWLQENGYRCTLDGHGDPVVHVDEVRRKLVGSDTKKKTKEPNWDAMHGPKAA